ncbi:SPT3 Dosage dependent suppressor of Ty-induced promoter mutations-like protein [Linnemannia hyalina]|uniref:SPT3 Dosage dependent suppressor of Ty-induced promoter mutations-like protein n=1 Tax=Linnemannia hyalina TaxID=64524 RepID=A0A9P7XXF1_9FUNG|nr:SPT3 Dosage dependent suppressor of Ty-induced promoter mutations-like protein [Linnemannia hyalina]
MHALGPMNTYYHIEYESSQGQPPMPMNRSGPAYSSQGWMYPGNTMLNSNVPVLSPGSQLLQGMTPSRTGASRSSSDALTMRPGAGLQQELNGYSIDARIIQKKDQMEDSSAGGASNMVEKVRTGQQFLTKLQLTSQAGIPPGNPKYPTMRVDRREAINTAGEPHADAKPLTLQVIVHLARSGQIRKGACAKCCHKLKRTKSMLARKNAADMRECDADTIATCFTSPIMCSGYHKARRVYPSQRPAKVTTEGPTPKTKTIKRQGVYSSPLSLMHDDITKSSIFLYFGVDRSNAFDSGSNTMSSQRPPIATSEGLEPQSQAPKIFEVRPDSGPVHKTTGVAFRGLFFQEGMVTYFGCFPAQDIVVETSNLILCKVPESPLPGTVPITLYDSVGNGFADLNQFTYTDGAETEILILQLQLRLARRALEYLHTQATGRKGDVNDILKEIPGLDSSDMGGGYSSGGNIMSDSAPTDEAELVILARERIEESLLTTLDQLPSGMDISFQLVDQGNLLHLNVLMGLDLLTMRLIEEGCELETLDTWAMTPLMYAVVKGNETIIRSLVIGKSSTLASVSRTRHSTTSRTLISSRSRGQPDMVEIEIDEGSISIDNTSDAEDSNVYRPQDPLPTIVESQATNDQDGPSLARLAQRILGVHINHDMPPLDQQDLPPMQVVGLDDSITIKNILKGDEIPRGVVPGGTIMTDNEKSGYHSGVYSEVQGRFRLSHESSLPSKVVEMSVASSKLVPSSSFPAVLPSELLGIRFPHEMVKRVGGRSASILSEMTCILGTSIELGQSSISTSSPLPEHTHHDHAGDGIELNGSCNSCSKFLHEDCRLSPSRVSKENPSAYPILQFSILAPPTEMIQTAKGEVAQEASTYSTGAMELRQGQVDVRARVNCSILHYFDPVQEGKDVLQRFRRHLPQP